MNKLIPVTKEGQIKLGDTIVIDGKNPRDDQVVCVEDIIKVSGNEEVIINLDENRYFITKLFLDGKSWAANVQVLEALH